MSDVSQYPFSSLGPGFWAKPLGRSLAPGFGARRAAQGNMPPHFAPWVEVAYSPSPGVWEIERVYDAPSAALETRGAGDE